MLRRLPFRHHNLLSTYRHGSSPNSLPPFPSIPSFRSPENAILPIQFVISLFLRHYSSDARERELQKKVIAIVKNSEVDPKEEEIDAGWDGKTVDELELKIFDDQILGGMRPPEPDEKTKEDVAKMVGTLRRLTNQMVADKGRRKHKARDQKGSIGRNAQPTDNVVHQKSSAD